MKAKYLRAVKALKRSAEYDNDARELIAKIEEEFPEEEVREKALALGSYLLLNYKTPFTVKAVEEDFKDLELDTMDIISVVEVLREIKEMEISIKKE